MKRSDLYRQQFMARTRSVYRHMMERSQGRCDFSLEELRARVEGTLATSPLCRYCRKAMSLKTWSLDHIVPVSRGGTFDLKNTQIICQMCNKSKGNRSHEEYMDLLYVLREWETRHRNYGAADAVIVALRIANSFRQGVMRRAKR